MIHIYLICGILSIFRKSIGSSKRHIFLDRQVLVLIDWCLAHYNIKRTFCVHALCDLSGLFMYRVVVKSSYHFLSLKKLRTEVFQGLFSFWWSIGVAKE